MHAKHPTTTQQLFDYLALFSLGDKRFVVQKHLHGFVQDVNSDSKPSSGGGPQLRGNLDIVGLQFSGKQRGRQLSAAAIAQARKLFESSREKSF